jgi:two-component system NtrC family sensor kinase
MFLIAVFSVSVVSILPTVAMTAINYYQYQEALHAESLRPMLRVTTHAKLSLESFLTERLSALSLASRMTSMAELRDTDKLPAILKHLKQACGGIVDLGVITESGQQVAYAGPYQLQGKDYTKQDWLHEVLRRGVHVSDAFMGHRNLPHFVVAVHHEAPDGEGFVMRATIDTEAIERQVLSAGPRPSSDAFIVNHQGILQTPSRFYGKTLEKLSLAVPPYSPQAELLEIRDSSGLPLVVGYAYVENSPFVLMTVHRPDLIQESWISLRRELILLLAVSIALVLGVVVAGAKYMVNRTRESDQKRAAVLHNLQYTSKMAAIGRLAAGVAHEINNPLAIINQKAGLIKDKLSLSPELPSPKELLPPVNSVLSSVDRCKTITHRLLGFAKHMDVQPEEIELPLLVKEVLSFLEKEASYRCIQVDLQVEPELPTIRSDRGQLQQVFLNILNNAMAAVEDGGKIEIGMRRSAPNAVEVSVTDDGVGISAENLGRIFEPFFSTKKSSGTGLGLSITYGVVQKLGGVIRVASKEGAGACFTVELPLEHRKL